MISAGFYDGEHSAFRDSVARFLDQSLSTTLGEWHNSVSVAQADVALAAEQGLLGINVPESCGGAGVADLRFVMVVVEEAMRRSAIAHALALALQSFVVVPALIAEERLADWAETLGGIADGRAVVAVGGTHQPLCARRRGQGIALSGIARSVIHGLNATHLLIGCCTDDGERLVAFVEASEVGVRRASGPQFLGAKGAGTVDAVFDDVQVAPEHILRQPDAVAALAGDLELLLVAVALGGAGAAVAWTLEYAINRTVFGSPLSTFENTRHVLAGLTADLVVARTGLRHALLDRCDGILPAATTAALATMTTGLYSKSVDEGLQLHGGYGYMHEYPIAQAFADAEFIRLLVDRLDLPLRYDDVMAVSL